MRVDELFDVKYGINLELVNCEVTDALDPDGINFVARTSTNNGVVAKVKRIPGKDPQPAGMITCAGGGSVLSTFLQDEPFYSGRDLYVLIPKKEMTMQEKLYYCMCIHANAYRYSYGRQANKTLQSIDIPEKVPDWINSISLSPVKTKSIKKPPVIDITYWGEYLMGDLFDFVKGKRLTKADMIPGNVNFLGAISENNGVRDHIETNMTCNPNCITVNYNGSVGEAFYQAEPFWASDDVNILYAKNWTMNKYIALFLITVIKANQYRFSYGRKWTIEKMKATVIKLPTKVDGTPDFVFMEEYIKSLPYSDRI